MIIPASGALEGFLALSVQMSGLKWIGWLTLSTGDRVNIPQALQLPQGESDFREMYPDERACIEYLFHVRWPEGFECPSCMWLDKTVVPSRTVTCRHCGNRTSLTTDTVMHGTKKPLCTWLLAIWWICVNDGGNSAKDLQRLLHLSSYQTAWTWMQKLRAVMAAADDEPCQGLVEIGSAAVAPAWEKPKRALVIAAAETIFPSGITGRIRMQVIDHLTAASVSDFLRKAVQSGSSIVGPGLQPYLDANPYGSAYVIDSGTENPARINDIISSFEIWLNKVHRGGVAVKHLQHYLDEFCFRNNSVILPDRQAVFNSLLAGCMDGKSKPYRELVSDQC